MRKSLGVTSLLVSALLAVSTASAGNPYVEDFTTTAYRDTAHTTAWWDTTAGELRLPPFRPAIVGSVGMPSEATDVAVDGDYACVTDLTYGLRVVDIHDPANPTIIGTSPTGTWSHRVEVAGDYAYVVDYYAGLKVVDIHVPSAPGVAGTYLPGWSNGVAVEGGYAYMACDAAGFRVVDISDPSAPTPVGAIATPGKALCVVVAGYYAFVGDITPALRVVDVSDPTAPVLAGSVPTVTPASGVGIAGDWAYVGADVNGFYVLDITDPAHPALVDSIDTPGRAGRMTVAGEHAYVCDGTSGLKVIEVARPAELTVAGSLTEPTFAPRDVAVSGNQAFVTGPSRFQAVDITNPANPVLEGTCFTPHYPIVLDASGDHLFLGTNNLLLYVADVTDPSAPFVVSSCGLYAPPTDLSVSGNHVFLTTTGGFEVVDVADPTAPVSIGLYPFPLGAQGMCISGGLAFLASPRDTVRAVDISNPATPTLVGAWTAPDAWDVCVSGNLAFVACDESGLQIFDITNAAAGILLGWCDTPGQARQVRVAGDLAFVTGNGPGLQVIDITDPAAPALVRSLDTPGTDWRLSLSGDYAFVTDIDQQLDVIRVFQRTLDDGSNLARSLRVNEGTSMIHGLWIDAAETGSVDWEVSADGGANWQATVPDGSWLDLLAPGNDLRWRSTLTLPATVEPTVSSLRLEWLPDHPVVQAIEDVPADQGGWARLTFARSGHDFPADDDPAEDYIVWRRIDAAGDGGGRGVVRGEPPSFLSGVASIELPPGTWEILTSFPALEEEEYTVAAPTLGDSTASGVTWTAFVVSVHTATANYVSPPDSGYSIDNIAPGVPQDFAVDFQPGTGNELSWDEAPEPDFQYFRVYRDTTDGFTPSEENLIHMTAGTEWVDPVAEGWRYYYQLTSLDHAGNESDPASASVATAVPDGAAPEAFALLSNVPNPFNPVTTIRFDVPRAARVRLAIYDTAGRLVTTLLDAERGAGRHQLVWRGRDDAGRAVSSGVYLVVMRAGDFESTRKMTLTR